MRIAIVGVGNRVYGDDGVGVVTVEVLSKCSNMLKASTYTFETLNISLIYLFNEYDLVIFVDGVPEIEEPKLYTIDPSMAGEKLKEIVTAFDHHTLNPAKLAALAYASGLYKSRTFLVGIPIKTIELGAGLSDKARSSIPKAIKIIARILEISGAEILRVDEECMVNETRSLT